MIFNAKFTLIIRNYSFKHICLKNMLLICFNELDFISFI